MDIEFHYFLTGLIAYRAGFNTDDARIIAYASQYVDENDLCLEIEDRSKGEKYFNYISQTMDILKPKNELMRIYPIFHFIPGEPGAWSARRRDGKRHILNTTPNSENANEIIDDAFKADEQTRLFRIGIASHSYVDTWAHQNFVGWYDYFNNIGLNVKPDIGHADAEHHPDWVNHLWVDTRLVEAETNNLHRFLSAAKELFRKYCDYHESLGNNNNFNKWADLEKEMIAMQGRTYTGDLNYYEQERLKRYKDKIDWLPDFDELEWFDEAIETETRGLRDTHDGIMAHFTLFQDKHYWKEGIIKEETKWFRFQRAVKQHEKFGIKQLSPVFAEMGYNLAEV
ncbi:MAG: cytoplasmic protein [bacterium]|nr:MAG: cytoplasmic protein [bacterium]